MKRIYRGFKYVVITFVTDDTYQDMADIEQFRQAHFKELPEYDDKYFEQRIIGTQTDNHSSMKKLFSSNISS